jgi:DNA-binding NarL/FixJ family response regulator
MRTVFIVGSDAFVVASMRLALRHATGINVVGVLDDEASVRQPVRDAEPDVVLIDAGDSPPRALDRLHEVREARPEALVVVIAADLDLDLFERAAEQGALVCLGTAALVGRLHVLLAGPTSRERPSVHLAVAPPDSTPLAPRPASVDPECPLTRRELEILRAVAEGHTNARIGKDLWLTEQTVKFHLSKIYRKLGVANRTEASRYVLLGARRLRTAERRNGHLNGRRILEHARDEHPSGHRDAA